MAGPRARRLLGWLLVLMMVGFPIPAAAEPGSPRPLPGPLRGVTTESVDRLPALLDSIAHHRRMPTLRIVFQIGTHPGDYAEAIERLHPHAYLMGTIADSTAVSRYTVRQLRNRTRAFVRRFGDQVDLWEVGNELNGEWVGRPRAIIKKTSAVAGVVHRHGLRAAVTLNYWPSHDCYSQPWEETYRFADRMPQRLRDKVDYLLLSFYETACSPPAHPSSDQFVQILRRLAPLFPGAKLGIGEIGAQGRVDGLPEEPDLAEKQRIARRYYGMHDAIRAGVGPRYVGGYFWWYYARDAVPRDRPQSLWPTLDDLLTSL